MQKQKSRSDIKNKKKILPYKTISGLKIGSAVGIIILLLGIAVFFGMDQMLMVSNEAIGISDEYYPLNNIINELKFQQQNQAINLEKIVRHESLDDEFESMKSRESFWLSSGIIHTNIDSAQKILKSGIDFSNNKEVQDEFRKLEQQISEIRRSHIAYEESAMKLFSTSNESEKKIIFEQIQKNELDFQDRLDLVSSEISILIQNSIQQIEQRESNAVWGQFLIIVVVGIIAALLVLFLNQINRDLANEVKIKTSDLQTANEKLRELDKMKDEFIGIASHELRSPIQPIFGFAELAKAGDIDQDEAWSGVIQLAKKLQGLANDVLDVSRIDSNRLVLHKEPTAINELIIDEVSEIKRDLGSEIGIQLNLDKNIKINLDKIRIEQVLRNLLNNAIKFTEKGTIKIETHVNHNENKLHFVISDSGTGIPNEMLPKIFDKFVTIGSKLNQSGTWLGLFLCKGIIETHGGAIFARNNQDQGATFEFTLPIKQKIEEIELLPKKQ